MTMPWSCWRRCQEEWAYLEDIDRPQLIVCSVDEDHDMAYRFHRASCSANTWRNSRTLPKHPVSAKKSSGKSSPY